METGDAERGDNASRLVYVDSRWAVYCPYASRAAYECWLQPRAHQPDFRQIADDDLSSLGVVLHGLLAALERARPGLAYNWWLHTSPFDRTPYDHYHWHIEVVPRISQAAGFEWGTGWAINPVDPAEAAAQLRRNWPINAIGPEPER
jgi:UDPglucose--hexose-1-phosphate uridylyltransferase